MTSFKLEWKLVSLTPSKLFIFLPVSDSNAKINHIKLSEEPDDLVKKKYYSYAEYKTKKDFQISAHISATVTRILKYKGSSKGFLKNEKNLLMNKTKKLVKGLHSAKDVYEWILKNTGFTKDCSVYYKNLLESNLVDLKRALRGESMCGGKSALFVSMCRNLGIPARVVTGYFLREGWTLLKNAKQHDKFMDLHVWAEYFDKGYWHPVDINIAQQVGKNYCPCLFCYPLSDIINIDIKGIPIDIGNNRDRIYIHDGIEKGGTDITGNNNLVSLFCSKCNEG